MSLSVRREAAAGGFLGLYSGAERDTRKKRLPESGGWLRAKPALSKRRRPPLSGQAGPEKHLEDPLNR